MCAQKTTWWITVTTKSNPVFVFCLMCNPTLGKVPFGTIHSEMSVELSIKSWVQGHFPLACLWESTDDHVTTLEPSSNLKPWWNGHGDRECDTCMLMIAQSNSLNNPFRQSLGWSHPRASKTDKIRLFLPPPYAGFFSLVRQKAWEKIQATSQLGQMNGGDNLG